MTLYTCSHCGGRVSIPSWSAWPEQCPHCRAWYPSFTIQTTLPLLAPAAIADELLERAGDAARLAP